MPQQVSTAVENNFTKGLITESTGLNFPENATTDCDNCEFTLIGDTLRRQGLDYEVNFSVLGTDKTNRAISTYKWNNAGGDGLTQFVVEQIGGNLRFYKSSAATAAAPLSAQFTAQLNILSFALTSFNETLECQFADGNGYLFVYHPSINPLYVIYDPAGPTFTPTTITVQIRDFLGVPEPTIPVDFRPLTLSDPHQYNLVNQGWISGNTWSAVSTTSINVQITSRVFTVPAGIVGVVLGTTVSVYFTGSSAVTGIPNGPGIMVGTVTAYAGTNMTINVTAIHPGTGGLTGANWLIVPKGASYLSTWNTAIGNYPSNADVWWYFKNASGVFDPATTTANTSLATGNAPRGHYILDAFSQNRDTISGLPTITDIVASTRPRTGTWFQGRVWYAGVDAQQVATGNAPYYTWTENIYFSQTILDGTNFGNCFQTNDPTSETLFDLLPTDGGVITIQGCGSIFKLFPIQNGMLVFAANGIWFITGSRGIGFAANDYTITKISSVQSISGSSFVNVQGLPYFWNEEGIYSVQPSKDGGLQVEPITVSTILSFYNNIPAGNKRYVRGDYHPINYTIQWVYRSIPETTVTSRYEYDRILNFNTYNKAFFPYTVSTGVGYPTVNGIIYVSTPGGSTAPDPVLKYVVTNPISPTNWAFTFGDEHVSSYKDWLVSSSGLNYISYFVTGYKLRGQAIRKFQPQYIQMYSRVDGDRNTGYKIQGIWNYAIDRNSNKYSSIQNVDLYNAANYGTLFRRHRIRGNGYILQFKIMSQDGKAFDIQGWSVLDTTNQGT